MPHLDQSAGLLLPTPSRSSRSRLCCGVVAIAWCLLVASGPATGVEAGADPEAESLARQTEVLATGTLPLQQRALRRLARMPGPEATRVIAAQLDRLEAGQLPLGLWLDVLEAATARDDAALKQRLAQREAAMATAPDPLKSWRECLEGGDKGEGREIFKTRVEAGCLRCHRAENSGGEIGPDLTSINQRAQRISVLESIVLPNAYIIPGFKSELIKLRDGSEVAGILAFESTELLRVKSITDGKLTTILAGEVAEETPLPSAMPEGFGKILGKRAIRDLIEYLFNQE